MNEKIVNLEGLGVFKEEIDKEFDDVIGAIPTLPENLATTDEVAVAIDNIQIGERNYILNTSGDSFSIYGTGGTNVYVEDVPEAGSRQSVWKISSEFYDNAKLGAPIILILDYEVETTSNISASGALRFCTYGKPWILNIPMVDISSLGQTGKLVLKGTIVEDMLQHKNTVMSLRMDHIPEGVKITFKNAKLGFGVNATDWSPAPEDLALKTEVDKIRGVPIVSTIRGTQNNVDKFYKIFDITATNNPDIAISLRVFDNRTTSTAGRLPIQNGLLTILGRPQQFDITAKLVWEFASEDIKPENFIIAQKEDGTISLFIKNNEVHQYMYFAETDRVNTSGITVTYNEYPSPIDEISSEYIRMKESIANPLLNFRAIQTELADLKAYIGYTDSDIYGLEADFENNKFTRLAGAVGKNPGADFDSVNAFGGRRRCALSADGQTIVYYGDPDYDEDSYLNNLGVVAHAMVEQPKFYYKVVPLKTEKIEGTAGYHLRKARYYISDTPKAGFKVHPAFIQNGVEIDKIYLSSFEGVIYDASTKTVLANNEQVADFDNDTLFSASGRLPATPAPQNLTLANSKKLAQNIGDGWGITTIQTLSATQLLFIIEYATFNSQSAIGSGVIDTPTAIKTGGTSSLGNSSGVGSNEAVSYRGEENLWGNMNGYVDNISYKNKEMTISSFKNEKMYTPYASNSNIAGYISAFNYSSVNDWCFIPSEVSGSSVLPVGDHIQIATLEEGYTASGGATVSNTGAGIFALFVNALTHKSRYFNPRLIYIPQTTEVTSE